MCACRLEETRTPLHDLVEFVTEMERKAEERMNDGDDIYSQLAQKDRDLVLAAELGKALLEQNQDLSNVNERLQREYAFKLEQLEQERHHLRRKLDNLEGEYEGKCSELQSDVDELRRELADQHLSSRSSGKEYSSMVQELSEQNHRLAAELQQVSGNGEMLSNELKDLKERFRYRRTSTTAHDSQIEMLREEITFITEKKTELEGKLKATEQETANISVTLKDSAARIHLLEKINRDLENKVRNQERDLTELYQTNSHLQERLEVLSRRSSTPPSLAHTSLLNELELSVGADKNLQNSFMDQQDEEDIECDDAVILQQDNSDLHWMRSEATEVYRRLRDVCSHMKRNIPNGFIPPTSEENLRPGMLLAVLQELLVLFKELQAPGENQVCMACGRQPPPPQDEDSMVRNLENAREELTLSRNQLTQKGEEVRLREEAIFQLRTQLALMEVELGSVQEERDTLKRDIENSNLSKDDQIRDARNARDKVMAQKKNVQMDLAKSRLEFMSVEGHLIEAVRQKLELAEQLELWQVDMQCLLDAQVRKTLSDQERENVPTPMTPTNNHENNGSPRKRFASGLWG